MKHDQSNINQRNELIDQLTSNCLECLICVCNIRRESATWSCNLCHNIFHLYCIKKWAQSNLKRKRTTIWYCPTCNQENDKIPNAYTCFCGKQKDPLYHPAILPHSCGEPCLKFRDKYNSECKHPCTEICHPGSCPQCQMLIDVRCNCGKSSNLQQCSTAEYNWSCTSLCLKDLNCGRHKCQMSCHSGPCNECTEEFEISCYSHKVVMLVACSKLKDDKRCSIFEYCCTQMCNKILSCGVHKCSSICHPGPCQDPCPMSPSEKSTCFCGKMSNKELNVIRNNCTDDVPSCGLVCNKTLNCGNGLHKCQLVCHEGTCTCILYTTSTCNCRFKMSITIPCSQLKDHQEFTCNRICGIRKNCLRHKCKEICCKLNDHVCDLTCNRRLSCGLHNCEIKCHSDPCPPCKRAQFEDVSCRCGKTIIRAPIPCGTKLPNCPNICNREHNCDHPVQHNCHQEEQCPPCVYLTSKVCKCGRSAIDNVQCFIKEVSCGQSCHKPLPCNKHYCQRVCHKGECLLNGEVCQQLCEKLRKECGHMCAQPCHDSNQCPTTVCHNGIVACCDCGRIQQQTICGIESQPEIDPKTVTIEERIKVNTLIVRYPCDKECERQLKLSKLAAALKIETNAVEVSSNVQYDYTEEMKKLGREIGMDFVTDIEGKLSEFVKQTIALKRNQNTIRFKPVGWRKRKIIHDLAPYYGCTTVVEGMGSCRYVVADAQFGYCRLPSKSLCDTIWATSSKKVPPPAKIVHNDYVTNVHDPPIRFVNEATERQQQKMTFASILAKSSTLSKQ